MIIRLVLALVSLSFSWKEVASLRLMEIRVPTHAIRNRQATLECNFDLDGEDLYAVKWYKDGSEFFNYIPKNDPPGQKFNVPGIYVDEENSSENRIVLSPVTLQSSGVYRCEISAEAPSFQTVQDEANMTVVALPDVGPTILGAFPRYKINEKLSMRCISGKSKPAAELTWQLNGQNIPAAHLRGPKRSVTDAEGLEVTTLGIHFRVKASHFKGSEMKLECFANINPLYSQSKIEIVGNIPQLHQKYHHAVQKPAITFEERNKETNMIIVPTEKFINYNNSAEDLNGTNLTSTATNIVYDRTTTLFTLFLTTSITLVVYRITEHFAR